MVILISISLIVFAIAEILSYKRAKELRRFHEEMKIQTRNRINEIMK